MLHLGLHDRCTSLEHENLSYITRLHSIYFIVLGLEASIHVRFCVVPPEHAAIDVLQERLASPHLDFLCLSRNSCI